MFLSPSEAWQNRQQPITSSRNCCAFFKPSAIVETFGAAAWDEIGAAAEGVF